MPQYLYPPFVHWSRQLSTPATVVATFPYGRCHCPEDLTQRRRSGSGPAPVAHSHPEAGLPRQRIEPAGVAVPHAGQSAQAVIPTAVSDAPYVPPGHVVFALHAAASEVWPLSGPNVDAAQGRQIGVAVGSFQYPAAQTQADGAVAPVGLEVSNVPHDVHVPPITLGFPQAPAAQVHAAITVEPAGLEV